ncbi:hypothetical protein MTO96_007924 [Rhipicephalus appendiculatus]
MKTTPWPKPCFQGAAESVAGFSTRPCRSLISVEYEKPCHHVTWRRGSVPPVKIKIPSETAPWLQARNPLLEDGRASGDVRHNDKDHSGSVQDEWRSIALLLFLYVLQGIPPGPWISGATVASEQACQLQGTSPVQLCDMAVQREAPYAIGLSFFWLSSHVRFLLGDEEGSSDAEPNVLMLTVIFLSLNFLAATQDIAVDGWALTMLSRRHVGYASTCNSVGQTAGYFLGNVVFLALESADFCNRYLRSEPQKDGIVTLDGFLYFWGIVFMVTTTLVAVLKHERDASVADEDDGHPDLGIAQTYKMALRIFHLPSVRTFCIFLFTCKVGFGVADSVTGLKLLEAGGGHRPLDVFFKAYPYRLLLGLVFMILLHWTYHVKNADGTFPLYYYAVIVIVYAVHQVTVYSIFVSLMAFHARVSDPAIGGNLHDPSQHHHQPRRQLARNTRAVDGGDSHFQALCWCCQRLALMFVQGRSGYMYWPRGHLRDYNRRLQH